MITTLAVLAVSSAPITVTPGKPILGARALALAAAPSGARFAATLEDGTVRVYDAATRMTIKDLGKHPQPAYAIAWSADGAWIATGDESARIFLWDTRTWKKIREFRTHTRGIQSLSFNFPRTLLLSTGKDDVCKVYNLSTGKESNYPGKGANFYGAKFISKMNDFAMADLGVGGRVYGSNGAVKSFFAGHGGQGAMNIAINRAGTRAVTAGKDATAIVWDMKGPKKLNSLKGHGDWIINCDFSPNGKLVATGSSDRSVRVWDVASFQRIGTLDNQSSVGSPVCFTADGKYLVTVNLDDVIQINTVNPAQPPVAEKVTKTTKRKKRG